MPSMFADRGNRFTHKVMALVLAAVLIVLGVIGVVLPILPGLVFLVIAAFVVAQHIPGMDARLRRYPVLRRHLPSADRYRTLGIGDQLRVTGLLAVKLIIEGFAAVVSLIASYVTRPR
jgi:uncharacterized membrane protein YbaN (DUF454 family)